MNYVYSTCGQSIVLQGYSMLLLQAFSDSDWATCPNSSRLVTSYVLMLENSLVNCKSKNNIMSVDLVLKPSIELLLMRPLKLFGL